jgi:hypothetical protein
MNKRHFPWEAILTFMLGIALGLGYAWVFSPVEIVDAVPSALRADFKDQYRAVIAAAYAADSNLTRAEARLALLEDADSYASLSAQAQRTLSSGDALQSFQLAQLASALQGKSPTAISSTPTRFVAQAFTPTAFAVTPVSPATDLPISTDEPLPFYTATPHATRTPVPPPGAPFELLEQETVCDESLAEGLLQVIAITANRRNLPGIELILSWAGGEEHFFTGFKPELGNGYADAILLPNISYTLRAAQGGTPLAGLVAPPCQKTNGDPYFGSLKITLYRP